MEVLRVVGKGGNDQRFQQRHIHSLLKAEPCAGQRAPYHRGGGQHPQQLYGAGRALALQRHHQRRQQEQTSVSRVANDHGKEQCEEAQKPERDVVLPIAGHCAQNVEHRDHQLRDLVVLHLSGYFFVISGGVVHGPRTVCLRGGFFEALRLADRQVAGQPHQPVLALGGIAHGGVFRVVLRFQQLRLDAGQVSG